ncbi:radical SAM protein [Conexibacter sp. DBS9H8]|uniref:radical SAM protein n=1 Tax=Conexibacter sp. DBS9H8 TaxID=2937801 RepID=UPI00200DCA73|nr:radical SAM protein [Conexibacter sp. DBS9H8]
MSTLTPLTDGMSLRLERFGSQIEFYAPGLKRWQSSEWTPENPNRFRPVSVTGTACGLQCEHCKTKVLEGMITLGSERDLFARAVQLQAGGTDGILVSGGSQKHGGVPLGPHLEAMARIREELGMRVVVHSGVISPELADGLADAGVDGVMLDIIGAEETIREVYHLDLTPEDFDTALGVLAARGLRIIPHIVLGLHYGRFLGEWRALEMIAGHPVSTLILVVLTPLVGTPMGHLPPPPVGDVTDFFALARTRMPDTRINLGCGRPMGATKVALDRAAIDHGLNGIAYPADGMIAYARERGLEPAFHEYCCSLTWADL